MLIFLSVALIWTLLGTVVALTLAANDHQCTNREAIILALVCGPGVWLFIASCFLQDLLLTRRS